MPEGRVRIALSRSPGGPATVSLHQPGDVGRLLRGKTPGEAMQIVPRVFSVCGIAQAHAAVSALEQALGVETDARTAAARAALTAMETLREHTLRIAFDWPRFLGAEPRPGDVAAVMKMGPALQAALFRDVSPSLIGARCSPDDAATAAVIAGAQALLEVQIFGEPLHLWLDRRGMNELLAWATSGQTSASRLFADIARRGWFSAGDSAVKVQSLLTNDVLAWLRSSGDAGNSMAGATDQMPETTPFARIRHDPLMTSVGGEGLGARLLARLVELAQLPERLRALVTGNAPVPPPLHGDGFGAAAIDAARGLLIHAAELRGGVIDAYRILPPTLWNFDANGVAARLLSRLDAQREADRLRQADMITNAIDPCVAYDVALV